MSEPFVGQLLVVPYTFAPDQWAFCWGQQMSISQYQALYSLMGIQFGGDARTSFNLPDLRGRAVIGAGQNTTIPGLPNTLQVGNKAGQAQQTLTSAQVPLNNHTHTSTFVGTGGGGSGPLQASGTVSVDLSSGSFSAQATLTGDLQATTGSAQQWTPQSGWTVGDTGGTPIYADPSTGSPVSLQTISTAGQVSGPLSGTATTQVTLPVTGATGITGGTVTIGNAAQGASTPVPTMSPYLVMNNIIATLGLYPPRP